MGIGTITKYKIGYEAYGIKILRIFPQRVVYNHNKQIYKWYDVEYYITLDGKIWFAENYQIDTIIDKRKLICKDVKKRCLEIKLMLDKKYEG